MQSENRAVLASALGASLGGTAAYRLTRRGERKPTTSAKPEEKKPASKVANFHLLDYVYITESINQPLVKAAAATLLLDYKDKEFTKEAFAPLVGGLVGAGLGGIAGAGYGLFKNWRRNLGFWNRLKQMAGYGLGGMAVGGALGTGAGFLSGLGGAGAAGAAKAAIPTAASTIAPALTPKGQPVMGATPKNLAPIPMPEGVGGGGTITTSGPGIGRVAPKPGLFGKAIAGANAAAFPLMMAQGFLGGGGGVPAETPLPETGYDPTMGYMTQYGMPLDYQQQAMMARFGSPHGMTSYAARLGEFVKQAALPQFETKPLTAHTAIADYIANKKYKPEPNEYTPSEQAQLDQLVKSMSRSAARTVDESRRGRTDVQNKLKKQFLAAGLWQ
jgi:hypothetical protein